MNAVEDKEYQGPETKSKMITGIENEHTPYGGPQTRSSTKRANEIEEKQDDPPQTRLAAKKRREIQEKEDDHPQTRSATKKRRFIGNDFQKCTTKLQAVRFTRAAAKKARANIINQIIEMKDCVVRVEKMII